MRLKLLYEHILTYEQFIEQPNWEDILYTNYLHDQPPLAAPNPALSTINNDVDRFDKHISALTYTNQLPELVRDRLTKALILKIKNPYSAYHYANYYIMGRWPEAEEIIKQDPDSAFLYAAHVINGRWPEAEEIIKQDRHCYDDYTKLFSIRHIR